MIKNINIYFFLFTESFRHWTLSARSKKRMPDVPFAPGEKMKFSEKKEKNENGFAFHSQRLSVMYDVQEEEGGVFAPSVYLVTLCFSSALSFAPRRELSIIEPRED